MKGSGCQWFYCISNNSPPSKKEINLKTCNLYRPHVLLVLQQILISYSILLWYINIIYWALLICSTVLQFREKKVS
jgi:hypothetical protein